MESHTWLRRLPEQWRQLVDPPDIDQRHPAQEQHRTPHRKCPHQLQQCSPGSPGNGATAAWIWLDPAARGRRLLQINALQMACPRALAKTTDTLACPRGKEQQTTQITITPICPMEEVCPSARAQLGWPPFLLNDSWLWGRAQLPQLTLPLSVYPSLLLPPPGLEPGSLG